MTEPYEHMCMGITTKPQESYDIPYTMIILTSPFLI